MKLTELKQVGLTSGEIKVYKALLDLGEATRTNLAKKSGVSASKIYDVANRLQEKGLISIIKKQNALHFSPAPPNRLKDFIAQKQRQLKEEEEVVDTLLPQLLAKYQARKETTDIEAYYGWEGLKTVFVALENSMTRKDTSLVFGASIGKNPKQGDIFFAQHQKRLHRVGYRVKIIFNEDMRVRKQRHEYYRESRKHSVRFLHSTTLTELYVFKEDVLVLMLLSQPIAIKIKNKEAVEAFTQFFNTFWKQAKE